MTRLTIDHLVTSKDGLGYCCLWFFLTRFRRTRLVADRLGVSMEAVNAHRRKVKCGQLQCESRGSCMDVKITMQLRPRQPRGEKLD